jgi:uncharacterized protein YbaR (Trm112 family)
MAQLSDDILKLLVCPKTKLHLEYASMELIQSLNTAIAQGSLNFINGTPVTEPLIGLLIRSDKNLGYGVFDDIPNLLADEGISLEKI